MKWLKIAGGVVVGLALAIFALMGLLYATRGTPTSAVRAFGDPAGPPAAADSVFTESLELLTHTDVEDGHIVEFMYDGNHTYPRFFSDLNSARKSITMQMYYCEAGIIADSVKNILTRKAGQGVRVLLLLDAFGSTLSKEWEDSLRSRGVRVAQFRPVKWYTLHKAGNRSHIRITVVDDSVAWTGGLGIADKWLGDGHHDEQWRDTNVRFSGPSVAQMQAAFATAWAEATGELMTGRLLFAAAGTQQATGARAGLLYTTPSPGSTAAERYYALMIAGARRTLYISNAYFVPDDDMQRFLVAAAKRGVDVRVLTAGPLTDVRSVRHAGHKVYERLLRGGVRIFEFQPAMLHAKALSVDGVWAGVGTMNFDNRSIAFNDEAILAVRDSGVTAELDRQFQDDLRHSNEFKLETFGKRSVREKLLDWACSKLAKVL
ncbi:MAG TPA: phospholipase D-like domain-containing protein [Longimicrobiales bacterium]|nr:phospholipase D-like domain-containing protein [Longimicrobiales bacterium]